MALLRYTAKLDPFFSLDFARLEGRGHNPRKGRHQILPSGNLAVIVTSSSSSGDWEPVALSPSQVPSSGEWVEVGDWKDMTLGGMGIPSDWRQVKDWEDVTASKVNNYRATYQLGNGFGSSLIWRFDPPTHFALTAVMQSGSSTAKHTGRPIRQCPTSC